MYGDCPSFEDCFPVFTCWVFWLRQRSKWGHRHIFGQFPHLLENRGKSRRIQSRDIKHILYPRLFVKYEPFSCIGPYYRPTERTNKINNVRVCLCMSHRACFYSWECRPHWICGSLALQMQVANGICQFSRFCSAYDRDYNRQTDTQTTLLRLMICAACMLCMRMSEVGQDGAFCQRGADLGPWFNKNLC